MGVFTRKAETLNERIKNLRKKKGMTQLELAEKVHVTDKAVSKWETGEGNPEITILIELANIFEVSLDYLLTGKEKEPEIIVMSKMELSCKEDNVDLFKGIDLQGKDESGHYITYYLEKYKCPNVYKSFISRIGVKNLFSSSSRGSSTFNKEQILKLIVSYDDVQSLEEINFFQHTMRRDQWGYIVNDARYSGSGHSNIYSSKLVESLLPLLPDESSILTRILSINEKNMLNSIVNWQIVYTNILGYVVREGRKAISDKIVKRIIELNNKAISDYEEARKKEDERKKDRHRFVVAEARMIDSYCNYSVIAVPVTIIESLLNSGDIENAKILNNFNKLFKAEFVADGTINAESMKKDGKASKDDIFITSCMEFGTVNIDKLLKCNDFKLIKYAFENYPICFQEMLEVYLTKKQYRELYEFAVDNEFSSIANSVLCLSIEGRGIEGIKSAIKSVSENVYLSGNAFDVNRKHFVIQKPYGYWDNRKPLPRITSEELKDKILKDLQLKIDKETLTNGLTKEYFESLLQSNNLELLVIKLCVKIEAILKCDYKYEGTFEEMLSKFTEKNGYEDDGWGYNVESDRSKLFHKLRKYRNGIVHPEQSKEVLTVDELKSLIKYVCDLG
ncbi:MAG TPA: helix-turn-helix transcriptional regulator [Mollicutes bacterium]|nr:helix-turn-helix transcriptional regulator [Mollicutes bacterium]